MFQQHSFLRIGSSLILSLLLLFAYRVSAQPISGIINNYTQITDITAPNCFSIIEVDDAQNFNVNDKVLIIQMKGAIIDSSNTISFGSIIDYNGAGNYETAEINQITGNQIHLDRELGYYYDPSGIVQLVSIPEYVNATVTGTITAQPWNGVTGGIVIMNVSETLTLQNNIDVSNIGFRGGFISNNPDGGCGIGSTDFYYPISQPGFTWLEGGAQKGEGIVSIDSDKIAGRGPLGNGGGGGNKHNSGGGGGGNYTSGGKGGNDLCSQTNGGLGGVSLATAINHQKIFMGGGGGCGDDNNGVGSQGANGGGIIIISANEIIGNMNFIKANGADQTFVAFGIADGAGGGGGGGSILLNVNNFTGDLFIEANGGQGGNQAPNFGCVGPGGGGGTGVILTCNGNLPVNVNTSMNPGDAGFFSTTGFSCSNTTNGAENGEISAISYQPIDSCFFINTISLNNRRLDTTLCLGDTLLHNPSILGTNYLWQDGSTDSTFTIIQSGTYWVQITLSCGSITDSIYVNYDSIPIVNLGSDTSLCQGDLLNLSVFQNNGSYLWQDNSTDSVFTVSQEGNYWVRITNKCGVGYDTININYDSLPSVNLGNDTIICNEDFFVLHPEIINAVTHIWQDNSTDSTFTVIDEGIYWLKATNRCGDNSDSIFVDICSPLFIANAFTPNQNGLNDKFFTIGTDISENDYNFSIYNRWGELIFRSYSPLEGWDGTYKNKQVKNGVYIYRLNYKDEKNISHQVVGKVNVIR